MHLFYKCKEKFNSDINSLQHFSHSSKRFVFMFVFLSFFFYRFAMGRKCNTCTEPGTFYMAGYTSLITLRGGKKVQLIWRWWPRCSGFGGGGRLTCDVGRHQPFSPDDLHLHDTHVFQVLEGPPHALEGGGGSKGMWISTGEKVGSIAWHFIKKRKG